MNFSSYEELYDVFKNTAIFYARISTRGAIYIPAIEANTLDISYGDNLTISMINQAFDGGYIKFNRSLIKENSVTIPKNVSSNTNRDNIVEERPSGLFICSKGKNASMPFDLSTYYNLYLLNRRLIFKAPLTKDTRSPSNVYYRITIPKRYDDLIGYPYLNSAYNCHLINLDNRDEENLITERKIKPISAGSINKFTLPKELNPQLSEGNVMQVIAERTKEMFDFPERAK
jgi:hypothetical protein